MKQFLVICVCVLSVCVSGFSQSKTTNHTITIDIPEVAYLQLASLSSTSISLNFTKPTQAGLEINNPLSNSTIWLNYSSIVMPSGADATRSINVKSSIAPPSGIGFSVEAGGDVGQGAGNVGNITGNVNITTGIRNVVTNVRSCYTGVGPNKGHLLRYSATTNTGASYGNIVANNYPMTITYTLTDN